MRMKEEDCSFDITLNRSGKVSIQFRAVDNAGNEVKYDTIAPTVSDKLPVRSFLRRLG